MDLTETAIPTTQLAKRYRVSKQAISAFIHRKGITRSTKPKRGKPGHTEKTCLTCQSLLRISKKPRSNFICRKTLEKKLGCQTRELSSHLNLLKKKGLVSQKFGKLVSKKAEAAYQLYFKKRLPVEVIGRQAGLRNFHSIIQKHKASGWNIPPPLFTYGKNERRKRGWAQAWAK